ncbi:MAG: hypothetical protein M3Z01_06485 [Thermoproteota archaeon]|nr:hypothetical protein [Thermoproteota archaeon]
MSSTVYNKGLKSPKLQAVIVEPILVSCIYKISIYDLVNEMQRILPLLSNKLKKYLFHLINYELISYNGQKQVYIIEDGGLDLLYMIKREKEMTMSDSNDIIITLE